MIAINYLDPRNEERERSLKLAKELEIEKVTLFGELDPKSVRVRENLLKVSNINLFIFRRNTMSSSLGP